MSRTLSMDVLPNQERLWFLDQLEPGSPVFNAAAAFRLTGRIDRSTLRQCLNAIVRRHMAWQASFALIGGRLRQSIQPAQALDLSVIDLAELPLAAQAIEAERSRLTVAQYPFDLSRSPLLRIALLRSDDETSMLVVAAHRIVADEESIELFVRELAEAYGAIAAGEPSPTIEPALEYLDFVRKQQDWFESETFAAQLAYWREQLAGTSPVLALPTDRPRPPVQAVVSGLVPFTLPPALSAAIAALGEQEGVPTFVVLLAAFQVVLSRYSGQTDFVVGCPIDNRDDEQLAPLVGPLTDLLPLRVDLSGYPTFRELIARVHRVYLEARARLNVPFAKTLEVLPIERSLSYAPLFQVTFALQAAKQPFGTSHLTIRPLTNRSGVTEFDLSLRLSTHVDLGLAGELEYNTALFEPATPHRMLDHWQHLLENVTSNPDRPLADFSLLTETEQRQMLVEWNNTAIDADQTGGLHERFMRQAGRRPESIALIFGDEHLTYAELDRRSSQLANHLQHLGVGSEVRVGVCVERTTEMVVGLLGVLKAGGAYVPLDPAYPQDRLAFMLEDSASAVLLTLTHLLDRLPARPPHTLCLDADWPTDRHSPFSILHSSFSLDTLAYIIYTSGSTGRPKGVAITHRNAAALLNWATEVFSLEELSGVLAATSICFDLSIFELFLPLSQGGTIVLAENVLQAADAPWREAVTLINTVPSAMAELMRLSDLPASVRTVNLAGEPLKRDLAQQVYRHRTVRRVFNLYGPSEDTTYSTFALVERENDHEPSIGKPIANTQAYILDADLQPVPIGVQGELYLGGDGLARGYLNRPDLTAERFIPTLPLCPPPSETGGDTGGGRLYRTGDLARFLPDGNIEFLGRADHQVKLRGFRIELGEIETALAQHPAVYEASVVVHETASGAQLAAYFVAEPHIEADALRRFLKDRLPDYMLPAAWIKLDSLPRTPNGKIDRRALPAPDRDRRAGTEALTAPDTPVQAQLAEIWSEVLNLKPIGIHDNFFDLGGQSLLATRIISRVNQTFQIRLPLRAIFESPALVALAQAIESSQAIEAASPLLPVSHDQALPLSFAQRRLWFLDQLIPNSPLYNIPILFQLIGKLDRSALQRSLDEIIRRHEALRTTFVIEDGQPFQMISPPAPLAWDIEDLRSLPEVERHPRARERIAQYARRPFALDQAPLLSCLLLRVAEEEHWLLLRIHHLIFDGWSTSVLMRELADRYAASSVERPPLPDLQLQYADFADWQRQELQGATLEKLLAYWKDRLQGSATLTLPTDRPRSPAQRYRGARQLLVVAPEVWSNLEAMSRREKVTPFIALLSAFAALLHRYSGQTDLIIGTPIAGRNRADIENLIGLFVNTLPIRIDASGDPRFSQLLIRAREAILGADAHQDLPFERLVEAMRLARDLSYNPLFQIVFAFQVAPPAIELPDLSIKFIEEVDTETAKFDLTLTVEQRASETIVIAEYNRDLFEAATIDRTLNHFHTLLAAAAANPDRRLAELPLLTETERIEWLATWNDTRTNYPDDLTLAALFEARVRERPDAIALTLEDTQLTYAALDRRANQLAHRLHALGVRPDVPVALCLDRSLEMIVGVLGCLKAGGAYVPIDPAYPKERLAFMLSDTGAPVILSIERLAANLPPHSATLICLDADWPALAGENAERPAAFDTAENIALIIYTSGSTGVPKGITLPHRAIARLVCNTNYMQLRASDRVAHVSSVSFDAATFEIWSALSSGGQLIVIEKDVVLSPQAFARALQAYAVTTILLTTALFNEVARQMPDAFGSIETLMFGGEAADPDRVRAVLRAAPPRRLLHMYGPAESATYASWCEVRELPAEATNVPIGRPVANTQLYVLDDSLQPVPIGAPGELYIGGDGLAHGYLNRPDLTAEKFAPNLFSSLITHHSSLRLYKTGDRVRRRADGDLEFIGRDDFQVKIRGFRIELGEIETALSKHDAVEQCLVLARSRADGEKFLAAYFVARREAALTAAELRAFLREKLPEYMLPAAFVRLAVFPLTPNGKVDREALPEIESEQRARAYLAARTPIEASLAKIWAEVLGVTQVSIDDNFFDLGGHSLLGMQLLSRLDQTFQVELGIYSLFQTSTLAELATLIDEKRSTQGVRASPDRIERRPRAGDRLPLSFAQQQMWLVNQYEPGSPVDNIPAVFQLLGALNRPALSRSLDEIVRRHESLRTTFGANDGVPWQSVALASRLGLPLIDLGDLPASVQKAEAGRLALEEAQRPFDLARGPLLRAALLRLNDHEHHLLLNMHHIVSDGWSMGVLHREVGALYEAFIAGRPSPLPELEIQYADFARWQRDRLRGETLAAQLAYWKEQLAEAPPSLDLPISRPRPAGQNYQGRQHVFILPEALAQALNALSRQRGVTLFMTLLAAFKVLLHRYTNQSDLVVGSPIANRNHVDTEALIGFFVNMLALRTRLDDRLTFYEFLNRVRETTLAAYAHQELPFEALVAELRPERQPNRHPLVQIVFALQNAPFPPLQLKDLRLDSRFVYNGTAKTDLSLSLMETAGELRGEIEYNADLFDPDQIERLAGHFATLLAGIAADPDRRLADLPLLTNEEARQVLHDWNDTYIDAGEHSVVELFEAQVERMPDAIALIAGSDQLTYRQLADRASRLAHHLRSLGAGPETVVGLYLERSLESVIALLGILKAGGAYLPLDPALPRERIAFILADSGARFVLTYSSLADRLPAHSAHIIHLDTIHHSSFIIQHSSFPLDALAYIIYTSGSTGRPKGVLIPHRALANHCRAIARRFELSQPDRTLQFAALSFDVAAEELFPPLVRGAAIVLRPDDLPDSFAEFSAFIDQMQLTLLNLPAAYWHAWAAAIDRNPPSIRLVVVGNEAALPERLALWREKVGAQVRWLNAYGPTETTITATLYEPSEIVDRRATRSVPIGQPIDNVQAYVLDAQLRPTPIGVPGELYIGGAGLARGYLNRPDLTAERFIPTPPFPPPSSTGGDIGGGRLCKTGDLARWLPDGAIEFLGRVDDQVKVRGYRIEPGEVEARLRQHASLRDVAVVAEDDGLGSKRLIAYLVAEPRPSAWELGQFLKETLPDYMLPSAFEMLEALPRLPNGKVDRGRLPQPTGALRASMEPHALPRSPVEAAIAGIWAEVLTLEDTQPIVGIHDNFFELGGHSLLATQAASRIRQMFRIELSLRAFFETPTVADLAHRVEQALRANSSSLHDSHPAQRVFATHESPLSFAQQRLWFLEQLEPGTSAYNLPIAIRFKLPLDATALERCLNEIIRRHESLRTTFKAVDGRPMQAIAPRLVLPLPLIDLSQLLEAARIEQARQLAGEAAWQPFDLERGPLLRWALLKLDAQDYFLLLTMHHIVSDGWSMEVFARELATLYQAFAASQPAPLPELPIQYTDFARRQRQWLQSEAGVRALAYWQRQLEGAPPAVSFPIDRARSSSPNHRVAYHTFSLPEASARALRAFSRQADATLFMTLLAAFQALLARYADQEDIVVGTYIANRTHNEVEKLIGYFVNTLALRTDLSGDPSFRQVVQRVREVTLSAYAYQEMPFEKLLEAIRPERSLDRTPFFQVAFVLQNVPSARLGLPGLELGSLVIEGKRAHFDLTLWMADEGEQLAGSMEYNAGLFAPESIARLADHFRTLLMNGLADPDRRLSQLALVSDEESERLPAESTTHTLDADHTPLAHQAVAAQAAATPDAVAIVSGGAHLTYAGFDRRADRLAHELQSAGVGPEARVALFCDRSIELAVAMLATLKAGGAYVPLDPAQPPARLTLMLSDVQPTIILTHSSLIDRLPAQLARTICLDTDWPADLQPRSASLRGPWPPTSPVTPLARSAGRGNLQLQPSPDNLAYVIYTSGSTGVPKGVLVTHRSLRSYLVAIEPVLQLQAHDRVLQFASPGFDASIEETFPAWQAGATVVLRPDAFIAPDAEFDRLIACEHLTVLSLPVSFWHEWVNELARAQVTIPASMRWLLLNADAPSPDRLTRWRRLPGSEHVRWLNTYGPTETTVTAAVFEVTERMERNWARVPIGLPLANTRAYVLDRHLQPAPIGVPGELYLAGESLTRGYLNRPELTAERFIPNPFTPPFPPPSPTGGETGGGHLYKTGDRVRRLPNGQLEFLGRIDRQVKVRGFRIEPGEIEAALHRQPAIREAIVLAQDAPVAEKRLIAYLVLQPGHAVAIDQLIAFLKASLPDYMIPSTFIYLDDLPRTLSGKIDRPALAAVQRNRVEAVHAWQSPRTPVETVVRSVWEEILKVGRIDVYDDFFALGGDPMSAGQVIARINDALQIALPLRSLFENPTIAGLAERIEVARRRRSDLIPDDHEEIEL